MPNFVRKTIRMNLMSDTGMLHMKTFEYDKIKRHSFSIARELGYKNLLLWKKGEGIYNIDTNKKIGTLREIANKKLVFYEKTLIVLQDIHRVYDNEELLINFQKILEYISSGAIPVNTIGISPIGVIPEGVERFAQVETIDFPPIEHIRTHVEKHFEENGVLLGKSITIRIAEALMGLIEDEVSLLLNRIIVTCFKDSITIDENILYIINEQKRQLIKKSGILEFVTPDVGIDDVGGLHNLKRWLRERKAVFDDTQKAKTYGVKPPKGILLFGMPGSGKSLVAKVSAHFFNLPLLRVDMGLVYGQKSPEEAIGRMIALADAISPCVLWIDELEKALSGAESGGNNDVAIKILGILLTWMQERTKPVFIIATANDISMIRPEVYRDGRIDEKFMLGFLKDDIEQIGQIIEIHLKKRLKNQYSAVVKNIDYEIVSKKMDSMVARAGGGKDGVQAAGYTGANMEALVEKVLQDRFSANRDTINTRDFVRALNNVYPQQGIEIKRMLRRAEAIEAVVA